MKIKMYQADAFTGRLFGGNPAAVCILDEWLSNELMQAIAAENNLAETAFIVKNSGAYGIRWFTPTIEVALCGHATLASAHVVFNYLDTGINEVVFHSPRSGVLKVNKNGPLLSLDFPADEYERVDTPGDLVSGLGVKPVATFKGKADYMAVLASEGQVKNISPVYSALTLLKCRGIIVTAKGDTIDFVSRFFAPQSGINEDPVTGSAHTTLAPYWAKELGKKSLSAVQLSPRKGYLQCEHLGARVKISGHAVTYLAGEIEVT